MGFEPLSAFLDSLEERFGIPGCDCAVAVDGRVVYRHSAGFSDPNGRRPVSARDTYWIYSATKLFTVTAAMRLIERGLLALDAPVSRYLPEFGHLTVREKDGAVRPARSVLTVRHLLTMTGGLDYDWQQRPALLRAMAGPDGSTRRLVSALAGDPLQFDPGTHFLYSLCHDVLGAVIEVASGQRLSDYVNLNVIQPLGMTDTAFHPTAEQLARLSTQYAHTDLAGHRKVIYQHNPFRFTEEYEAGGAGLLSTVDDCIRLAAALSMDGAGPDGYRLLSPASVALMASPQLGPVQRKDFLDRSPAARGYSYGLGVRVLTEKLEGIGSPLGEFGWDGAAGAYVLVDRTHRLAMYYAQQVCQSYITFQYLHPQLREALYRCGEAGGG